MNLDLYFGVRWIQIYYKSCVILIKGPYIDSSNDYIHSDYTECCGFSVRLIKTLIMHTHQLKKKESVFIKYFILTHKFK